MTSERMQAAIQSIIPAAQDCSDRELLERYASGRDGAAFAELLRRHGPMVYGTCLRIAQHASDADDAFQATFFVLARKAESIRAKDAVGAWLHRVAVRVAQRARQQAFRHRRQQMAAARPEAVHPAPPTADWWAVVDEELNQLSQQLRLVLLACDIGGKSRSEAAREFGWPEGTVAKRLARARQELARRLTRRGVTLTASALVTALAAEATAAVPSRLCAETFSQATAYALEPSAGSLAVRALAEGVMGSMMKTAMVMGWLGTGMAAMILAGAGMVLASALTGPTEKTIPPPTVAARAAPLAGAAWKKQGAIEVPDWLPGSLAYSPRGKWLAIGGSGGKVHVHDMTQYKLHWTADVGGSFAAVAFLADGSALLATCKDGVRYLDPDTGKPGKSLEEPGESPDWRPMTVAAFPDRTIEQNLVRHQIIFGSPAGYVVKTWYASGAPSTLVLGTVARGARPADAQAVPLAVDPNGRSAIITGPIHRDTRKNVLWAYVCGDYDKGSPGNRLLVGHDAAVVSAAWSKDGKTAVTGDAAGRIIVWDAQAMKETRRLQLGQRIAALALTADGRQTAAIVVGKQAAYHVWLTAQPPSNPKALYVDAADFGDSIQASVAFSPDDRQLVGTVHDTAWRPFLGRSQVHVWETTR